MALNQDRNTPSKEGRQLSAPVAAGAEIFAGALLVADANGYAAPGSTALNLTYLGRADEHVDNTAGADGDATVLYRRGIPFAWKNSAGDPVTQASLGKVCYIEDDETVAATDGTGTRSAAGNVVEIDADTGMIWVE